MTTKRKTDDQLPFREKQAAALVTANNGTPLHAAGLGGSDISGRLRVDAPYNCSAEAKSQEEAEYSMPASTTAVSIGEGQLMSSPEKRGDTQAVCSSPMRPSESRWTAMEAETGLCDQTAADEGSSWNLLGCPLLNSLLVYGRVEPAPAPTATGWPSVPRCKRFTAVPLGSSGSTHDSSRTRLRPLYRKLAAQELAAIQKMEKCFRRTTRIMSCCRQATAARLCDSIDNFVLHAKNAILGMLEFASYLPEFRRKPPYVQVALVKAASASYLLLRSVQAYDVTLCSWRDERGSLFGPDDMARLLPSTGRDLWCSVASLAASLRPLLCCCAADDVQRSDEGEGGDVHRRSVDAAGLACFALLHVVLLMSPEHVPCRRERDRDIAADVSDCQQAYILLLRHHLEAWQSLAHVSLMLPTLLEGMAAIKRHSSVFRSALLSEQTVRSDPVLSDALSLLSLPVNSRSSRRSRRTR